MDTTRLLKKYWWVAALIIFAILSKAFPDKPQVKTRDYTGEGKEIITRLREPKSVEELTADYASAEVLLKEMQALKDSASDNFILVKDELDALVTYKDKNIESEGRGLKIKSQFSEWDGSNRIVTKAIKERMNNPDSYEHVKTEYSIDGNRLLIHTTFRGTNTFNAVVTNEVYGVTDIEGNLIELEMQS